MPDLTNEQIRDRLAEIAGWKKNVLGGWDSPVDSSHDILVYPIPPLDSPEALGMVVKLLPKGYALDIQIRDGWMRAQLIGHRWFEYKAIGCQNVALAVIAAHEAEGGKPNGR